MKNVIFIHCGNITRNRCQRILDEIGMYISDSGIINDVDQINLEVVGEPTVHLDLPKVNINFNGTNVYQWEFPTLEKIIDFAKHNSDYNILYLHTKGSSRSICKYSDDVRNYHLYWTVTNYKKCLDALRTHDVVGAELQFVPVRHYSHNMWWTRASHVNKLKHPLEYPMVLDERHQAEFWIGQDTASSYHSVFSLYDVHTRAFSYEKHLYRLENEQ